MTSINGGFILINMKERPYMTLTEAAERLGVSRQRVYAIIKDGRLDVVNRIGGLKMILLDRAQVEQLKRKRDKRAKR